MAHSRTRRLALTPKEEVFVLEYCLDWDHHRAALAAGYPTKYHGTALLRKQRIATIIDEERDLRRDRLRVDADRITEEFAKVAYANARDFATRPGEPLDITRLNSDQTAAIETIQQDDMIDPRTGVTHRRLNLKLHDKVGALNSLAKSVGMLAERHIVEGTIEFAIKQLSPEERIARVKQLREKAESVYLPQYEQMLEDEAKTINGEATEVDHGAGS